MEIVTPPSTGMPLVADAVPPKGAIYPMPAPDTAWKFINVGVVGTSELAVPIVSVVIATDDVTAFDMKPVIGIEPAAPEKGAGI